MTEIEITLFKELIKETVRGVIKEEKLNITEEVKKTFAKDLKEIKLLIAKQIKENREKPVQTKVMEIRESKGEPTEQLSENKKAALKNILGGMGMSFKKPDITENLKRSKLDTSTKSILLQTAKDMTEEDMDNIHSGYDSVEETEENVRIIDEQVEEAYNPRFSNMPELPI